jgi:hypothetical protein
MKEWLQTDPLQRSASPHVQIGTARRITSALQSSDASTIEETVCFGLIILGMRSFHARFSRMDHHILDRIVELSEQFQQHQESQDDDLPEREHIGFLTMVAVEASDKCIELQPHVKRMVDLLTKRERFARSWAGMEKVMKRFFWVDFAAADWKSCWQKHLQRRAEAQRVKKCRPSFWQGSDVIPGTGIG